METNASHLISDFLAQAKTTNLITNHYPKTYRGLKIVVSFGKGNIAKVPWICFLGKDQKASDGIYPIFLYFKKFEILVLAYGVSETMPPVKSWKVSNGVKSISEFFRELNLPNDKYEESFVFKSYHLIDGIDTNKMVEDLNHLIDRYEKLI